MPIEVEWDDAAQTTLQFRVVRPWTWEQIFEAAVKSQAMARSMPHKVYTISDARAIGSLPPGILAQLRRALLNLAPNRGGMVLVSPNPALKAIVDLFKCMNVPAAQRWASAACVEEARQIIAGWKAQQSSRGVTGSAN
jgi:hypothetical protein